MAQIKVKIRNRVIVFDGGTSKADIARTLFEDNAANYTTNEVSKAVPMAYSQAMTIKKKMDQLGKQDRARKNLAGVDVGKMKPNEVLKMAQERDSWGQTPKAPGKRSTKPMTSPVLDAIKKGKPLRVETMFNKKVGKLRTPGLPSDTDCGECANCGYDVVIRQTKEGLTFVHTGVSTEEYLSTVQFCHAVPKVLLA